MRDSNLPPDPDFIVADADYYRVKARQCVNMANGAEDRWRSETLKNLAVAFERKARSFDG
jgi:hypothetical protein